ncbi:hypothetical protein [Legionella impletisoli]|uniref:Transmembrane protein n=1 Tax=Legionella impletisoli TaxID=343510 RepID=A0A917JQC2_9GAMM|nr:hypothetical protein [Legionella impletisoli]GGI81650.1 hypothetical protein GCM10007966_07680 [Legionella impletisoli]
MNFIQQNHRRRLLKYTTDVFINPFKSMALVLKSSGFIIAGCIGFILAELLHCYAHIEGARQKYQAKAKSLSWMIGKIGIKAGRLVASITGAVALALLTILVASPLVPILACISIAGFMISSIFSTLHKGRGLIDHLRHGSKENLGAYNKKRNALIIRATIGVLGTALAIVVILKLSFVMALLANPIALVIGAAIFAGMAIWKACIAFKEYKHPKHMKPAEELNCSEVEIQLKELTTVSSPENDAEPASILDAPHSAPLGFFDHKSPSDSKPVPSEDTFKSDAQSHIHQSQRLNT